jgi:enoyl-[acyl-carrier-protein] reductase (NADH)
VGEVSRLTRSLALDRIPLGHRLTMATDIGHAAVGLISDQAAHVTGEMAFVDGGYRLR